MSAYYKNETFIVISILLFDFLFLLFGIKTLSISYSEAWILFKDRDFIHYFVKFFVDIFGNNDYALRLPFVFFHILSAFLLYKIGKKYLKKREDRILSLIVYLLLPGANSAALAVNASEIVIFLTLLFIYLYENSFKLFSYFILTFSVFIDNSFSILYISLIFYSLYIKDNKMFYLSLLLFGLSMYLWGFDTGGKPKDYFIETLAVYMAIFSPFVFLYFFYTEYRILIKERKNLLWFISFIAFIFSLLLSFRQKVILEDFAPFAVIATPLMVRVFLSSYRVRIRELRFWHRAIFVFILFTLSLNFLTLYFNKFLYIFLENSKKHFVYRYDFARQIAQKLKKMDIYQINSNDKRLLLRLKFYGIKEGGDFILTQKSIKNSKNVTISYYNKPIFRAYVSKIHKKK